MATISIYSNKINSMAELIGDVIGSVNNYNDDLTCLKSQVLDIDNTNIWFLDDVLSEVINSIKSSTQTQEQIIDDLTTFQQNNWDFATEVSRIDDDVADIIEQNKDDFYEQYYYLKPECEKSDKEKINDALDAAVEWCCNVLTAAGDWCSDALAAVGEWCEEHWVEILVTLVIVILAVVAVVAIFATGGVALVPLLTALGMSLGAATNVSLVIAATAIVTTIAASACNVADVWGVGSDNPGFQLFSKIMNWTSLITGGLYSIGSVFNAFKGVSQESLKAYANGWSNKGFRDVMYAAGKFKFNPAADTSTFWAGLGKNGADIAEEFVEKNGGTTLWDLLGKANPPGNGWKPPSSSMAIKSSGNVISLLGDGISDPKIGIVWKEFESVILKINPKVTSITIIDGYMTSSPVVTTTFREFLGFGELLKNGSLALGDSISDFFFAENIGENDE